MHLKTFSTLSRNNKNLFYYKFSTGREGVRLMFYATFLQKHASCHPVAWRMLPKLYTSDIQTHTDTHHLHGHKNTLYLCAYVCVCVHIYKYNEYADIVVTSTWNTDGRPKKKNTTHTKIMVKNLTRALRPSVGNSSTNPVTTVSIRTI